MSREKFNKFKRVIVAIVAIAIWGQAHFPVTALGFSRISGGGSSDFVVTQEETTETDEVDETTSSSSSMEETTTTETEATTTGTTPEPTTSETTTTPTTTAEPTPVPVEPFVLRFEKTSGLEVENTLELNEEEDEVHNSFINNIIFSDQDKATYFDIANRTVRFEIEVLEGGNVEDIARFKESGNSGLDVSLDSDQDIELEILGGGEIRITAEILNKNNLDDEIYNESSFEAEYTLTINPGLDKTFGFNDDAGFSHTETNAIQLNITDRDGTNDRYNISDLGVDFARGESDTNRNNLEISYKDSGRDTFIDNSNVLEFSLNSSYEGITEIKFNGSTTVKVSYSDDDYLYETYLVINVGKEINDEFRFAEESSEVDFDFDAASYDIPEVENPNNDTNEVIYSLESGQIYKEQDDNSYALEEMSDTELNNLRDNFSVNNDEVSGITQPGEYVIKVISIEDGRFQEAEATTTLVVNRIELSADNINLYIYEDSEDPEADPIKTDFLALERSALMYDVEILNNLLADQPVYAEYEGVDIAINYEISEDENSMLEEHTDLTSPEFKVRTVERDGGLVAATPGTATISASPVGNEFYSSGESAKKTYVIEVIAEQPRENDTFSITPGNITYGNKDYVAIEILGSAYFGSLARVDSVTLQNENGVSYNDSLSIVDGSRRVRIGHLDVGQYTMNIRVNVLFGGYDYVYRFNVSPANLNPVLENGLEDTVEFTPVEDNNYMVYRNRFSGADGIFNPDILDTNSDISYTIDKVHPEGDEFSYSEDYDIDIINAHIRVSGSELQIYKTGEFTVTATINDLTEGDINNYTEDSRSETFTITVTRGEDTDFGFDKDEVTVVYSPDSPYAGSDFDVTLNPGRAGGVIEYSSSDDTVVSVDATTGEITTHKSGTATITASSDNADGKQYENSSDSYEITVLRAGQTTLEFENDSYNVRFNDIQEGQEEKNLILNPLLEGESLGAISYESSDTSIATVDENGLVTILRTSLEGPITITATKAADDKYEEDELSYTISIDRDIPEIEFDNPNVSLFYGDSNETFVQDLLDVVPDEASTSAPEFSYVATPAELVVDFDENTGEITFRDDMLGQVVVTAIKPLDDNYEESTATYTLEISLVETPEVPVTYEGTLSEHGWYSTDVRIVPAEGFQIGRTNERGGTQWEDFLLAEHEGEETVDYYLRDLDGNISERLTTEVIKIDKTNPIELEIDRGTPIWATILETITFGFYQAPVEITLSAEDTTSGIDYIEYTIHETDEEPVVTRYTSEGNEEDEVSFTIDPQFEGYVEFVVADLAGNTSTHSDETTDRLVVDEISPILNVNLSDPVSFLNDEDEYIKTAESGARSFYSDTITVDLEIDEEFFLEGLINSDTEEVINLVEILVHHTDLDGETSTFTYVPREVEEDNDEEISIEWVPVDVEEDETEETEVEGTEEGEETVEEHKQAVSFNLEEEGTYQIEIIYQDASSNPQTFTDVTLANAAETDAELGRFLSNELIIDRTAPVVTLGFNQYNNNGFYNQTRTATIRVEEVNFHAPDFNLNLNALGIDGSLISNNAELTAWLKNPDAWTQVDDQDIYVTSFNVSTDAHYTLNMTYSDLANNVGEVPATASFVVDQTAPESASMTITYSTAVLDRVIEAISFGYYQAPVTVTLQARDATSRIQEFRYSHAGLADIPNASDASLSGNAISYSHSGRVARASFQISPQFRGTVSFYAIDQAFNNSTRFVDSDKELVVDSIAPTRTLSLNANQVLDSQTLLNVANTTQTGETGNRILLLNENGTANLTITEANFYAEDVNINLVNLVTNERTNLNTNGWTSSGDVHSTVLNLNAADGRYSIQVEYTDRSGNQMASLNSDTIIIDRTAPVISMSITPDTQVRTVDGTTYYASAQNLQVTVVDANFRADDFDLSITSTDVAGGNVAVADYAAQLRTRSNWSSNGNVHTATISLGTDANYTVSAITADMAGNVSEQSETLNFAVDTTAPRDIVVSYQTPLNQVGETNYYQDAIEVSVTSLDDTSGVFTYSYEFIRTTNTSGINRESFTGSVDSSSITYSDGGRTANFVITLPAEQTDGYLAITAHDRADNEFRIEDTTRVIIDNQEPVSTVTQTQAVNVIDDVHYYDGEINLDLQINEANFNVENVTVLVSYNGGDYQAYETSAWTNSGDVWSSVLTIPVGEDGANDGSYQVRLDYTDEAGNQMQQFNSELLILDTTAPRIELLSIENENAYDDDTIGFTLKVTDANLDHESLVTQLEIVYRDEDGNFVTETIDWADIESLSLEELNAYIDNLGIDGAYTLTASVRDLASNSTDSIKEEGSDADLEEVSFSVNRDGSVFLVEEDVRENLNNYYLNSMEDLVITEISVNELTEQKVIINDTELEEGRDFEITQESNGNGWYRYDYIIAADNFAEDNHYEVVVRSTNQIGNEIYSDIKGLDISFVIDTVAPLNVVSGIEENGLYASNVQNASVLVTDDGGLLETVTIQVLNPDGEEVIDTLTYEGEEIEEAFGSSSQIVGIPEGQNLSFIVRSSDMAGNVSETRYDGITVSTNFFVLWYSNTPLFVGSIAGAGILAAGLVFFLAKRKKKGAAA